MDKKLIEILDEIALYDYEFDGKGVRGKIISLNQILRVITNACKGSKYRLTVIEDEKKVLVKFFNIEDNITIFANSFKYTDAIHEREYNDENTDGNLRTQKKFAYQSAASYFARIIIGRMFNIDANETEEALQEKENEKENLAFFIKELKKEFPNVEEELYKDKSSGEIGELLEDLRKAEVEKLKPKKIELRNLLNNSTLSEELKKRILAQIKIKNTLEELNKLEERIKNKIEETGE